MKFFYMVTVAMAWSFSGDSAAWYVYYMVCYMRSCFYLIGPESTTILIGGSTGGGEKLLSTIALCKLDENRLVKDVCRMKYL